jgi:hypothetical protein
MTEIVEPESFLVHGNELEQGEADRAREWGVAVGRAVARVRDTQV